MIENRVKRIVRAPGFDPAFILRLLDMGVQEIQLPHVNDAEAARAAVRAVRYPPLGDRGMMGGSRAADYGMIPLKDHMAQSNREITLAVMIEELSALDEIDAIASTAGIDLVVVGPADMSRAAPACSGSTYLPKAACNQSKPSPLARAMCCSWACCKRCRT